LSVVKYVPTLHVASILIVAYLSFRFNYKFAICAILALLHDVFVLTGVYSILGRVFNLPLGEINTLFVTAVLIQRDTGGNLPETLVNLAHVVRERFKIRRQVRVHTAHGRFTGYVLLALPAALAIALSFINPEHMQTLFRERVGQLMLMGAIVMQTIGFIWIRQVIKIEV